MLVYIKMIKFQIRLLTEKVSDQPECSLDKERIVEFSSPTWQVRYQTWLKSTLWCWIGLGCFVGIMVGENQNHNNKKMFRAKNHKVNFVLKMCFLCKVLNGLEKMGYRVVSCSSIITGYAKFDTKDVIWTLHKTKEEWEASSK